MILRWFSFLLIFAFIILRSSWFSSSASWSRLTAASGYSLCRLSIYIRLNSIDYRFPHPRSYIGF